MLSDIQSYSSHESVLVLQTSIIKVAAHFLVTKEPNGSNGILPQVVIIGQDTCVEATEHISPHPKSMAEIGLEQRVGDKVVSLH